MLAGAHARTIFAGLGVTGSLIGAIGAVFALTGGVLAFTGWPDAPAPRSQPALQVAATAAGSVGHARAAAPLQLPAAPARRVAARTAPAHHGSAARPGRTADTGTTQPTSGTSVTPATGAPGTAPTPTSPAAPAPTSSASGLERTTNATANAVRQVGTLVPLLSPVTSSVADTVARAGHLLGPTLQGLTRGG
jgi:hypothetical protein